MLYCDILSKSCLGELRKMINKPVRIGSQDSKYEIAMLTGIQACKFLGFCSNVGKLSIRPGYDAASTRRMENLACIYVLDVHFILIFKMLLLFVCR